MKGKGEAIFDTPFMIQSQVSLPNSITGSGDPAGITLIVPSAAAAEAAWLAANAEGTIGVMPAGSPEPVMELGRLT